MPKRYAKKRFNKKAGARRKSGKRRLSLVEDAIEIQQRTSRPTASQRAGNLRGRNPFDNASKGRRRGSYGQAKANVRKANSTNSAVNGFVVGKSRARTNSTLVANRKKSIMQAIMDDKYPVVSKHSMVPVTDLDWTSNSQGVTMYQCGYVTSEIETCADQGNAAQYDAVTVGYAPNGIPNADTSTNQRLHINPKKTIYTFKNTCTHTVTMEMRLYRVKGFHSNDFLSSWQTAMTQDNALGLLVTQSGTQEEVFNSIGCRPDMRAPELQGRFSEVRDGRGIVVLEPGQETKYTHHCEGFRYDKGLWNVLQGGTTDVEYCNHTYFMMAFCQSEMVTDAVSSRQTLGSGHVAVLKEEFSSFQALPYVKPVQKLFYAGWGGINEVDEQDNNQLSAADQQYGETE